MSKIKSGLVEVPKGTWAVRPLSFPLFSRPPRPPVRPPATVIWGPAFSRQWGSAQGGRTRTDRSPRLGPLGSKPSSRLERKRPRQERPGGQQAVRGQCRDGARPPRQGWEVRRASGSLLRRQGCAFVNCGQNGFPAGVKWPGPQCGETLAQNLRGRQKHPAINSSVQYFKKISNLMPKYHDEQNTNILNKTGPDTALVQPCLTLT